MARHIVLADEEVEVVSSPAALLGRKRASSHSEGTFGSTSVRVSHLTFRVGGWSGDQTLVEHQLEPIDAGDLVKTDRRLVYLGDEQTAEIQFSELSGWDLEGKVLRVFVKRRPQPYMFHVDEAPDLLRYWRDPQSGPTDPEGQIDPGIGRGWIQTGFPRRILLDDSRRVVDADPLLPHAAAYLDTVPNGEQIDARELARGLGISSRRAEEMLPQLEALGFMSRPHADGERGVFDPDGLTVPAVDRDLASPPGWGPDQTKSPSEGTSTS